MPRPSFSLLGCILISLLLTSCHAVRTTPELDRITGESLVFIGHEPSTLAFQPRAGSTLQVRSGYRATAETIVYAEGRDFAFDAARGFSGPPVAVSTPLSQLAQTLFLGHPFHFVE